MTTAAPRVSGFDDLEVVGRGGFSTVYSAVQVDLGRTVAIKVLNLDASEAAAHRRFERECKVVGILSGVSGVVAVHQSAFTDDGRPCIVMELMRGGSLESFVRDNGPLTAPDVLQLAELLSSALAAAHDRGVVHRDIKPGNVLLSGDGDVALADFGIAVVEHLATSSQTVESLSPPYAPPERLIAGELDEQLADIYSLGATLHFALVGAAPFGTAREGGVSALIHRVMNEQPVTAARADVPEAFLALVAQMLDKRPDRRPASVAEVSQRVGEALSLHFGSISAVEQRPAVNVEAGPQTVSPPVPVDPSPVPPAVPPVPPLGSGAGAKVNIPAPPGASATASIPFQLPSDPYSPPPGIDQSYSAPVEPGPLWPTAVDYVRAIQDPQLRRAQEMVDASVERDFLGMPVSAAGQSAVVFHLSTDSGPAAVRFFTRAPHEGSVRYEALAAHVARNPCEALVPARWIPEAIVVDDTVRPAVWMPWLPGRPLNLMVEDLLDDPLRLEALAHAFLDVLEQLRAAGIAHGDLQNGNVLVDDDLSVRLVDLDGIWIPALEGSPPHETGHRCFQHPKRQSSDWGPAVDTFAGLLIYTSLLALAADPTLWSHHQGENLVLGSHDLNHPAETDAWAALLASRSSSVRALAQVLVQYAQADVSPAGSVADLVAQHAPPDERTMPKRSPVGPTAAVPVASLPEEPDDSGQITPGGANWWKPPADRVESEVDVDGAGVPKRRRLVDSAPVFGALAGLVAGLVGAIAQWPFLEPSAPKLRSASSGIMAVVVAMLLCGFVRARRSLAARQYGAAARDWLGGLVLGALAVAVAAVPMDAYVDSILHGQRSLNVFDLMLCGLVVGGVIGIACGCGRSLESAVAGLAGGAVGGVVGFPLLWIAGIGIDDDGRLAVETTTLSHLVAVTFASAVLGCAIGIAMGLHERQAATE